MTVINCLFGAIAYFHEGDALNVNGRQTHLGRSFEDTSGRAGMAVSCQACYLDIAMPRKGSNVARQFVNVDVLVDLDDIRRTHLDSQQLSHCGTQPFVKIVPDLLMFEVRIHSWKR